MFTNIGNKIRTLAKVLCIIGIVLAALSGLIMMISGISMLGYSYTAGAGVALIFGGLVSAALGALLAWVGSFVLYGYGQLIHSVQQIEKKVLGDEYQDFDKQPGVSPFSGMNNAAPAAPVAPVAPSEPLPNVDINGWEFTLANSFNSITEFRPEHGSILGFTVDFGECDARIVDDAIAFQDAARNAGFSVHYDEFYICYEWAELRYRNKVGELGSAIEACKQVAGPGVGDHQTALGADFVELYGYGYDEVSDEAFNWLVANCADYGFILRYPEGKEMYYGYACPHRAHFRYVGHEAARYIMENDLCLEEFILLYDADKIYVPGLN